MSNARSFCAFARRRSPLAGLVGTLAMVGLVAGACEDAETAPGGTTDSGIARVTSLDRSRIENGYTLLLPSESKTVYWVATDGTVAKTLDLPRRASVIEQLPSGNLLGIFENRLVEYDSQGNTVWEQRAPPPTIFHHDVISTSGGTVFAILLESDPETKLMLDSVIEVSRDNQILWRWDARDHIDVTEQPYHDNSRPIFGSRDWLHINSIDRFPNGDLLLSVRNLNRLIRVAYPSGDIIWSWGEGVVAYPHSAKLLPNGHITVFDNGIYRQRMKLCDPGGCVSRALELDPETGRIVWEYQEKGLFSRGFGDVDRLPNGNTLITYGQQNPHARILEVAPDGEVLWTLDMLVATKPEVLGAGTRARLYRSQRVTDLQ